MNKLFMVFILGIILVASNLYAADGDLIVDGTTELKGQVLIGNGVTSYNRSKVEIKDDNGNYTNIGSYGPQVPYLQIGNSHDWINATGVTLMYEYYNDTASLASTGAMRFYVGWPTGVPAVQITSTGNVGIGTTSPQSSLSVSGLPNTPPAGSTTRGIVCITTDGDMWVDDNGDSNICG